MVCLSRQLRVLFLVTSGASAYQLRNDGAVQTVARPGGKHAKKPLHKLEAEDAETDSFQSLQDDVGVLASKIKSQEEEGMGKMTKEKKLLEEKLQDQRDSNGKLERSNQKLAMKVASLEAAIPSLRSEAETLLTSDRDLEKELKEMQDGMSMAKEFVQQASGLAEERLDKADELKVLAELDEEEGAASHAKEVENFGKKVSMLGEKNPGDEEVDEDSPVDILDGITAKLSKASEDQDASVKKLHAAFDDIYAKGDARNQELLKAQEDLQARFDKATDLTDRLKVAIAHLKATKSKLSERVDGVKLFSAKKLGDEEEHSGKKHKKQHAEEEEAAKKKASKKMDSKKKEEAGKKKASKKEDTKKKEESKKKEAKKQDHAKSSNKHEAPKKQELAKKAKPAAKVQPPAKKEQKHKKK